ncbi:hypothetical protein B0H65DRAFT_258264 [Neurospora tetraspora]|uniref:Uncharacterized protein n=1 Tax=Neurospora tetraspora TaxID=94610 RepID=A0AAE0JAD1_9PEZI|nr:hypothetical protein B0H65DRAFT_258264 [Neurospora tetraspora]
MSTFLLFRLMGIMSVLCVLCIKCTSMTVCISSNLVYSSHGKLECLPVLLCLLAFSSWLPILLLYLSHCPHTCTRVILKYCVIPIVNMGAP